MNADQLKQLEDDLWSAADNLRANSDLKSSEYATPVLGLIFLKFADNKYEQAVKAITQEHAALQGTRREKSISDIAIQKCGFYLPDHARYSYLLDLPESEDLAKKIKQAMEAIEEYKPELDGILPKDEYVALTRTSNSLLGELLKSFSDIPRDASGDIFGKIYEFFLSKFALSEGQKGGEFFTPTSVVKLMVEIIEPHHGTVYDPACGSAGMFVQSQLFVERHRKKLDELGEAHDEDQLYVYGQEKTLDTVKLAKMNLAVNGLRGEIRQANSYTENPFDGFGKFDFVMANPPFNVDDVPLVSVEDDSRFNTYGLPRKKTKTKANEKGKETVPNANYLWINLFATSLKNNTTDSGRAALVMANSASDARHSEADIRRTLIENNLIYGMLTLPSNMFYTVTLPATLWFFDKNKQDDRILFIDARNIFTQIDRAHREFSQEQVQNIAIISKLHKGKRVDFIRLVHSYFLDGMKQLKTNQEKVEPVCGQLLDVLDDTQGKQAVGELISQWQGLKPLQQASEAYIQSTNLQLNSARDIEAANRAQHALRATFAPFFQQLHTGLKQLDKVVRQHEKSRVEEARQAGKRTTTDRNTRRLKEALEELHKEVRSAEAYYQHIHWLQERFPKAEYEDVTGLCKLATPEQVKEQDYSLNPGRYVGVVIEKDGKTEEEFLSDLASWNQSLGELNSEASNLVRLISENVNQIVEAT